MFLLSQLSLFDLSVQKRDNILKTVQNTIS